MKESNPKFLWIVSLLLFVFGFGFNLWLAMTVSPDTCVAVGGSCQDTLAFGSCATWFFGILSLPFTIYLDKKNKTMMGWIFSSLIAVLIIVVSFYVFIFSIAICTGLDNAGYERVGEDHYLITHKHLASEEDGQEYYTFFYKTGMFTYTYCFQSLDEIPYEYGEDSIVFTGSSIGEADLEINYSDFR